MPNVYLILANATTLAAITDADLEAAEAEILETDWQR